jgi:hypothetical protein
MKIIRVFPRKTKATPDDENVRINCGPTLFDEADEVHISVAFTWDLSRAEWLANQWAHVAPVKIGGPATGEMGGDFTPGMYLKKGYVITSRGCPNHCWFCSVPQREGDIRELPITEGWNVLDDNLLACESGHVFLVYLMLKRQKHPIEFTGGLEAARLHPKYAEWFKELPIKQMFFAYDTPDDLKPLQQAGTILRDAGFPFHPHSHMLRCFVLCGYPSDTFGDAFRRMHETMNAGFTPMAMLWRNEYGRVDTPDAFSMGSGDNHLDNSNGIRVKEWRKFQREWARPAIIYAQQTPNGKEYLRRAG